jgi:hypothetical protein
MTWGNFRSFTNSHKTFRPNCAFIAEDQGAEKGNSPGVVGHLEDTFTFGGHFAIELVSMEAFIEEHCCFQCIGNLGADADGNATFDSNSRARAVCADEQI